MSYRYLPPGKHFYCEFVPARGAKSPAIPHSSPAGDSRAKGAIAQRTQSEMAAAVIAADATGDPAASSHDAASAGDWADGLGDRAPAMPSAVPAAAFVAQDKSGEAQPTAAPVASVATDNGAAPHIARRPLSSDDVARALVYVECGYSLRAAAAEIGRHHSTLIKRLKSEPALSDALAAAREKARSAPLAQVREASKTSWRAAAWLVKYLDARDCR